MLKKTLLALSVAWSGSAAAASNSLDDVTMNIVNESAFQEIINAGPAEVERMLQVNGNAQPVRTVVLQNMDATLLNATPINTQVLTVNRELNQGMVSFSFACAEGQECQQRVESLNTSGSFILGAPVGSGINVLPNGIGIAPVTERSIGEFIIVDQGNLLQLDAGAVEGVALLPLEGLEIDAENVVTIDAAAPGSVGFMPAPGL